MVSRNIVRVLRGMKMNPFTFRSKMRKLPIPFGRKKYRKPFHLVSNLKAKQNLPSPSVECNFIYIDRMEIKKQLRKGPQ